jgi:hypothetical protein
LTKLLQFAGFKLSWFGLILVPQIAIWPALLYWLWSIWRLAAKARIAALGIAAAGIVMDSVLLQSGVFSFVDTAYLPVWLLVLWGCFGVVLVQVLAAWLRYWWLAAVVGAVTGPLAYWGGATLGGQLLFADTSTFLLTLAPCWGLLLAGIVYCQFLWSEDDASKIITAK